jgi:hypothetical protein
MKRERLINNSNRDLIREGEEAIDSKINNNITIWEAVVILKIQLRVLEQQEVDNREAINNI